MDFARNLFRHLRASDSKKGGKTMSHESKTTTDHDEIRRWVEDRGGKPATIADTQRKGEEAGLLRIDMPGGASNPPLEPLSWEDFFAKFDEEKLAFLYQEESADGKKSHFCKFVSRESASQHAHN
jgi:hypothetical protein